MGNTIELRIRTVVYVVTSLLLGAVAAVVVTSAWSADAAPGDTDSTYVPTAGCRVTDTRPTSQVGPRSTKLGEGDTMLVRVHGSNGECTGPLAIPSDAVGLATNVTIVDATARSNVRVYRGDLATPPTLSNINVVPGGAPAPNKVDVQLAPDGTIQVYNFKGSVHVIIDVVGHYTKTSLSELDDRVAALEAAAVGDITMQNGLGPTAPTGLGPANIINAVNRIIVQSPNGNFSGAVAHIHGPTARDGVEYALSSLTYCVNVDQIDGSFVAAVEVHATAEGLGSTTVEIAKDVTPNNSDGCRTLEVNDTIARRGMLAVFGVDGDGPGDQVDFVGISSTWSPVG
ncbi:MAG: hypothetical protein AAFY28_07045 [Actinomycetota bacterium]